MLVITQQNYAHDYSSWSKKCVCKLWWMFTTWVLVLLLTFVSSSKKLCQPVGLSPTCLTACVSEFFLVMSLCCQLLTWQYHDNKTQAVIKQSCSLSCKETPGQSVCGVPSTWPIQNQIWFKSSDHSTKQILHWWWYQRTCVFTYHSVLWDITQQYYFLTHTVCWRGQSQIRV